MKGKKRSVPTSRRALDVVNGFIKDRHAYTNNDWERALDKLKLELCRDAPNSKSTQVNHGQVQDVLPLYVSDEQMGEDVQQIYPQIWEHLQSCPACRELYEVYAAKPPPAERKRSAQSGRVTRARVNPEPSGMAWTKQEDPATGTFTFVFAPEYIQTLRNPAAHSPVLRGEPAQGSVCLISDSLTYKQEVVHFTAWLEPRLARDSSDQIRLEITSAPFAGVLEATLHWNGKAHTPTQVKRDLVFTNLKTPTERALSSDKPSAKFALEIKIVSKQRAR